MLNSLRQVVDLLRKYNEVVDIEARVSANLEIPEIHRRVIELGGPALLFRNVDNSPFPVITNLFGTKRRIEILFEKFPPSIVRQAVDVLQSPPNLTLRNIWGYRHLAKRLLNTGQKKERIRPFPYKKMPSPQLSQLPLLTSWPLDGGAFITLPLVYTEDPRTHQSNLGMYRLQRFDDSTLGLHIQIQRGAGVHLRRAEELNQNLPVTVFLSGNPFMILSAIMPLPEKIPELLLCSFMNHKKLPFSKLPNEPHPLFHCCEFVITGDAPAHQRQLEGPFGDHFGYYSLRHPFPVIQCRNIYYKQDAIFPATVVGKPKQEDFFIGELLQTYLEPLIRATMPGILRIHSYGEAGFHALTSAIVEERYAKEALKYAFRILGEGQLSLTKCLFITDQNNIAINNFQHVLTSVLERMHSANDMLVFHDTANDTLDYSGPKLNRGSKVVFMGVGKPKRKLPQQVFQPLPKTVSNHYIFCPGCLCIELDDQTELDSLLSHPEIQKWPFVVIHSSLHNISSSIDSFLWHTFTTLSPDQHIHAKIKRVSRLQLILDFPIVIDCRKSSFYPPEVLADKNTVELVSRRWEEYFPSSVNK